MFLGGLRRVTSTRLDKVRAKVVFFAAMPASIGRGRTVFQDGWNDLNSSNYSKLFSVAEGMARKSETA